MEEKGERGVGSVLPKGFRSGARVPIGSDQSHRALETVIEIRLSVIRRENASGRRVSERMVRRNGQSRRLLVPGLVEKARSEPQERRVCVEHCAGVNHGDKSRFR